MIVGVVSKQVVGVVSKEVVGVVSGKEWRWGGDEMMVVSTLT